MAWLHRDRSGNYHVAFRFGGKKFQRSLGTRNKRRAEGQCCRVEENIRLIESGRLVIPAESDVGAFLLSDGKLNGKPKVERQLTLEELFQEYWKSLPTNSHEPETLRIGQIHERHLLRVLGQRLPIGRLGHSELQRYIGKRAKEKAKRGRNVSPTTVKKVVATLRTVWGWARDEGRVQGEFPRKLRYPKTE